MYKYKDLMVNDQVKIVKSTDAFTRKITTGIIDTFGIIKHIDVSSNILMGYRVYIEKWCTELFLPKDALEYYGNSAPFEPLHRVLPTGDVIDAAIAGPATKDNQAVIHTMTHIGYWPRCGSRSGLDYYDIGLDLAPKITCQKCLSIMYHKHRTLMEAIKYDK